MKILSLIEFPCLGMANGPDAPKELTVVADPEVLFPSSPSPSVVSLLEGTGKCCSRKRGPVVQWALLL